MLYLNIHPILQDRGIENPNQFLIKAGFHYTTASRLLNDKLTLLNLDYVEKLCIALHCSIEDIIMWEPGKNTINVDKHPLYHLKTRKKKGDIREGLKKLPVQKLEELRTYIQKLSEE